MFLEKKKKLLKEVWCYSKVACRRREIKTGCCDATGAEERKGARRRQCYISLCSLWHDEIFDNWLCGARVQTHWEKCGREVGMHEMEQKGEQRRERGSGREGHGETWAGFKVPRRNEQLEEKSALGGVCLFGERACVCQHMHLYTAAYLLACL